VNKITQKRCTGCYYSYSELCILRTDGSIGGCQTVSGYTEVCLGHAAKLFITSGHNANNQVISSGKQTLYSNV